MLIAIGKILLKLNPIRENIAHAVINDRWQYKNLTESFSECDLNKDFY